MTVKTFFTFYIFIDLLMAIAAKLTLFGFIKSLMAFVTFGFKTGMTLHQVTRHDQAFHSLHGIDFGKSYGHAPDNEEKHQKGIREGM